jgi:hypothetical protein
MAITENEYTGNGSTVLYSFTFPYLEVADIKVSLDGTLTTAYTLANATTVQFNTAPANGVAIRLFRQTNDDALNAQFFPGSAIRSTDLNNNFTQNLYVTQESNRDATQGITTADAATATANTALSNSSAAVSTANTASSNASAAVSTANTASSNASAAVSTANTASSNATAAVNTANAATATANSAASDAATAISTANSALSTANTASTTATNAVNTANSASSAASSAVSTANTASSNASAAVSTANTASSNATSAVNTANSALSTANAAASAVANAILYDIVANVAAIPASPANNDAVEVTDSTGIESFTPLTSIPGGFAGNSGLSVRIVYTTTGNTWTWIQYFPNDPETRYLKEAVTTSDTAPVSPSDGDLWYDSVGGRTYVYYDDGDTSQWVDTSPQGSGVSDAISEGNTSAEVIDTGSDGRFVVTTEGSERLRVDPSGRLLVGSTSNFANANCDDLQVGDTSTSATGLTIGSSTQGQIAFADSGDQRAGLIHYQHTDNSLRFMTNGATNERLRITSAGLVGIGTSSPATALQVAGAIRSSGTGAYLPTAAGTNWATTAAFIAQGSYGGGASFVDGSAGFSAWAQSSGSILNLGYGSVGGSLTAGFTFTNTGRLGIGTTSPGMKLTINDTTTAQIQLGYNDSIYGRIGRNSSGNYEFSSYENGGNLLFGTTGTTGSTTERVRIDSSGRVGIGTSVPSMRTAIYDTNNNTVSGANIWNYEIAGLQIRNLSTTANTMAGVYFESGTLGGSASAIFNVQESSTAGALAFATGGSGSNSVPERLRIDSQGRVGIGTTSPGGSQSALLHVVHSSACPFTIDGTSAGGGYLTIENNGLARYFIGSGAQLGGGTVSELALRSQTGGGITFLTNGANERARIDSSGRLLVGTSSTSGFVTDGGKFYLRNSGECMSIYNDAGTGWNMRHNATSNGGTFFFISFAAAGTGVGGITSNSTTTTYGTTSDYRLKENIEPITDSVDRLKQLNPCKFNFIAAPERTVDGFLAHEVQTHVPEAVVGKKDAVDQSGEPVYQNIDQSKLVPLLTAALQEAVARIEAQDTTIASLEARLTALEGGTN